MPLDRTLVAAGALLLGALAPTAPFAAALAALALAWLARLHASRFTLALGLACFAAGAARAELLVRRADAERERVRDLLGAPARCEAEGEIETSPLGLRGSFRFDARLDSLRCGEREIAIAGGVVRLYGARDDLARGDRVFVVADLAAAQLFANLELDDPRWTAARSGVVASGGALDVRVVVAARSPAAAIDRVRARVRRRIDATYPAGEARMARALVLGESDLEPDEDAAFRASGLSHLLAVSGTHLSIVVAGVVAALVGVLRRLPALAASRDVARGASLAGLGLAVVYADFAGGGGSVRRAAAMAGVALAARALGRRPRTVRAFGLSTLAMAVVDPLAPFDLSLTLSLAATGGLVAISPRVRSALDSTFVGRWPKLATALATTLGASLACAPLVARIADTVPAGGLFANLVAVPLGEVFALPLCLAHVLAAPLPSVERGLAVLGALALAGVRAIAKLTAAATFLAWPVPRPTGVELALLGTMAVVALARERPRPTLAALAACLLLAEARVRVDGAPRGVLRVTVLDVGQGDSTLVDLPDGRLVLVDGGGFVGSPVDPGVSVILPTLRARRRSRLDVAALSHPHPDHFTGLASALPRVDVGAFWDTGQGEDEGAGPVYAGLVSGLRARGVPVVRPSALCGAPIVAAGARLEVLGPCPTYVSHGHANDNSIVVRLSFGERAALLVGDAEHAEEARLVAAHGARLRADVLKVGHHGSRTSSSEAFLAAVSPRAAIVSCGVRNRFGHPHPTTLATLAKAGIATYRTDRDGAVAWETDGARSRFVTARAPR